MYSELLKAFQSNKNCSFYTDDDVTSLFTARLLHLTKMRLQFKCTIQTELVTV